MKKLLLLCALAAGQYVHAQQPPVLVKDLILGDFNPTYFFDYNGKLLFWGGSPTDTATFGLYISDGTYAGTHMIRDLTNGSHGSPLDEAVIYNGKVIFSGAEPCMTDGTNAGTTVISNINASGGSQPHSFTVYNSKVYFSADDGVHGDELWVTDGTATGTQLVKDINGGVASSYLYQSMVFNGKLYFNATTNTDGDALWVTDGTPAGTQMVKVIDTAEHALSSSSLGKFFAYNNKLFFTADDGVSGAELWITDGTSSGTHMVKDIYPGIKGSAPSNLITCNGKLLFSAQTATNGLELWVTDGTDTGTQMVKDINPGSGVGVNGQLYCYNNKLYFCGDDGNDLEPWVSDGTTAGTTVIKRIYQTNSYHLGSAPAFFTGYNNHVYFNAYDSLHGDQLWVTDGTAANTEMVTLSGARQQDAVIYAGGYGLTMLASGSTLYFAATYDDHVARELYKITLTPSSVPYTNAVSGITVYPNPATESLTIQYTLANAGSPQYRLYDVTGKCVGTWQDEAKSAGKQSKQLSMYNLAPAVYQLQIEVNGKVQAVTVVKQ